MAVHFFAACLVQQQPGDYSVAVQRGRAACTPVQLYPYLEHPEQGRTSATAGRYDVVCMESAGLDRAGGEWSQRGCADTMPAAGAVALCTAARVDICDGIFPDIWAGQQHKSYRFTAGTSLCLV